MLLLIKICEMFNDRNFAEGKCEWLKLFPGRFNLAQSVQLDLWGNEEDLFVSRLYSALETSFTSTCPSPHCPSGVKQICSKAITLRYCTFKWFNFFIRLYACYYPSVARVHRYNCMYLLAYPFYCLCVMQVILFYYLHNFIPC